MVKISHRITPDPTKTKRYSEIFGVYKKLGPAIKPLIHDLHRLRGGEREARRECEERSDELK